MIEQYLIALRYLKPKETEQQLYKMKLKEVEEIKQDIDSGEDRDLIKIVALVQNCTQEEVLDFKIIDFFGLLNSIREQIKVILTAEENAFTPSKLNVKWEMVNGAERMSKFGIYNTLESLSNGDATKYEYFMNMEYSEVFTILLMRKTASDISQEMNEIKTK
ncbi:MAG: hypothetical protein PVG07_00140 [Acidobacteriota bacterium]